MNKTARAGLLLCAMATTTVTTSTAAAAEQSAPGALTDVLDHVTLTLEQAGFTVQDKAVTNRFALVYAKPADGSFVTVAIRELPSELARAHIVLTTDTPKDTYLEQTLLRKVIEVAASN